MQIRYILEKNARECKGGGRRGERAVMRSYVNIKVHALG